MNFKPADISRYLKNPDLSIKCVLVFGTNEGMIADYVKQFALAVCPDLNDAFRVCELSMDRLEKDMGLLYGEYNARSLIGGRRVVIIRNADNNLTAVLKNLFKDNQSDTLLILSSTALTTKSSLVTLAKDSPQFALIGCYDDREESIYTFAKEYLTKNGFTINPDAMQLLCARLSADRKASVGELEKLMTFLGTRRHIELNNIRTAISDTSNSSQEDMCYLTAEGNVEKALDACRQLMNEGEEPVTLVRSLIYHFLKLVAGAAALENGQTADAYINGLRPSVMFFRKSSLKNQLHIWKRTALLDALDMLYKTERDCKTTGFPAAEILTYTLMRIAGAARKMSR